jgi:biotin-dependent carboxylase-like uncharacterized protein
MITLEVVRSGPHALVQDLGRPGLAHIGVTRSGAADRRSHRLANRLLANPVGRATIEVTLGGFSARVCGGGLDIAVTGADANPTIDGIPFGANSIAHIRDGQVITLSAPRAGLRSYLGVRGGIAVPETLGSRSYDTLSGIGPAPLRSGDVVPVGEPVGHSPGTDQAPVAAITAGPVELRMIPGPRYDWFVDPDAIVHTEWVTSDRSARVGVRLVGPALQSRWPGRQLPSEGAIRGAVQVPPNGQPVILGADHPVTGGYPVIGVVLDADTDALAQLRPGQLVRLYWSAR